MSRPLPPLLLLLGVALLPGIAGLGLDPAPRSPFRDVPSPLSELSLEGVTFALPGADGTELICRGRTLRRESARTEKLFSLEKAVVVREVEFEATDGSADRWRATRLQLRDGGGPVEWLGILERLQEGEWVQESAGRGTLAAANGRPRIETYPTRVIGGPR